MQEQDEDILQQQLQKEEQQKEKVSSDKARVDTLALNIKHWRSRAQEAHECFTCRRKLSDAEMVTFMQIQASYICSTDARTDEHLPVPLDRYASVHNHALCVTRDHMLPWLLICLPLGCAILCFPRQVETSSALLADKNGKA